MLKVENINIEYPQIGKEPTMGYSDEYIEKTMMSGLIKRIYKGKRFYATFSYPYLLENERATINSLLATQRTQGYLNVVIDTPFGQYSGQAILELGNDQTRFMYSNVLQDYVWTNWSITVKGARYDS
jgi:hypothetical protein